jgi:hypothetical protein
MWGRVYWPVALLVMSVGFFGIPELIALFTNPANTLSDYAWDQLQVGSIPVHLVAWYISLVVWLLFVVIITMHIWWRWT